MCLCFVHVATHYMCALNAMDRSKLYVYIWVSMLYHGEIWRGQRLLYYATPNIAFFLFFALVRLLNSWKRNKRRWAQHARTHTHLPKRRTHVKRGPARLLDSSSLFLVLLFIKVHLFFSIHLCHYIPYYLDLPLIPLFLQKAITKCWPNP